MSKAKTKAAAKTARKKTSSAPVQLVSDEKVEQNDRFKKIIKLCNENPLIMAAIVALSLLLAKLTLISANITAKELKRDELKHSSSGEKDAQRESAAETFFSYAKLLRSLGKNKKIFELINLPKISLSKLKAMRFSGFGDKAAEILALVKKYKTDLADYEVTDAEIAELEALLILFQDTVTKVDTQQAEGVGATDDLDALYKSGNETLDLMKDIIIGKRQKYPEFHNAFMAAMVIHHYGVRHEGEAGEVEQPPVTPPVNPAEPQ